MGDGEGGAARIMTAWCKDENGKRRRAEDEREHETRRHGNIQRNRGETPGGGGGEEEGTGNLGEARWKRLNGMTADDSKREETKRPSKHAMQQIN